MVPVGTNPNAQQVFSESGWSQVALLPSATSDGPLEI